MKQLIVLSSIFAALYNGITCESPSSGKMKRDTVNGGFYNFLPYNAQVKIVQTDQPQQLQGQGLVYFKDPAVQPDTSKQAPLVLQYQQPAAPQPTGPVSNVPVNQPYQTIPSQAAAPTAAPGTLGQVTLANTVGQAQYFVSPQQLDLLQLSAFNQQPLYVRQQQSQQNQYTVKQASLPQTAAQAGFPSSAYKGFAPVQFPNSDIYRYLAPKPVIYQSFGAVPQIHAKQVTTRPLVNHQIYHQPLHTSVKPPLAPVTHTVTTPPVARPVKEEVQEHVDELEPEHPARHQEQAEDEEQPQQQQVEEDEEEQDSEKQEEESEEEYFRPPTKYRFERIFKNDDDDEEEGRGFYRRHKNEHDEEEEEEEESDGRRRQTDRYSESRPAHSKLSSKYRSPSSKEGYSYYKGHKTGSDYKKPKVEYKMYQYSRSAKHPRRPKDSEGKDSTIIPAIHASNNLYEAKWMIMKTSSSR